MATKIFPSVNDVYGGGSVGDGKNISEENISTLIGLTCDTDSGYGENYIYNGFNVNATHSDLDMPVAGGKAIINGYLVQKIATEDVTLAASSTNYIYLKLSLDGSDNVTDAIFEANTTGTAPANSVLVSIAVTDATTVTSAIYNLSPPIDRLFGAFFASGTPDTINNGSTLDPAKISNELRSRGMVMSANTVTPKRPGYYDVSGFYELNATDSTLSLDISVYVNTTLKFRALYDPIRGTNYNSYRFHGVVECNGTTDYIKLTISVGGTGTSMTTQSGSTTSLIKIKYIGRS